MRKATRVTRACMTRGNVVFAWHRHGQELVHIVEHQHIGVKKNHALHRGSALPRAVDTSTHVKVHQLEHSQLCPRIPEAVIILHKRVSFRCRVDSFNIDDGYAR
jgi:hypothetical protein